MVTRQGWGVFAGGLGLLAAGVALGYAEIAIVGLVLVLAVASAFAWVGSRARIEVERRLGRSRVTVGDVAVGELRVTNPTSRTVAAITAFDKVGDGMVRAPVERLAAGAHRTVRYQLPTARRCVLTVGPLQLRRSDPFGLARFQQDHGDTARLYVHPRRHPLRRLPATLLRSLEGPTSDTAPRGSVVFHALREYVAGDDRRHIHWRSSARKGELMVRQYVDTSLPDLTVVLDNSTTRQGEESFEGTIEVVASILAVATEAGFPTRLVTTDGREFSPQGKNATQEMLDHLAGLDRSPVANLAGALTGLRAGGNTLVVVARDLGTEEAGILASRRRSYRAVIAVTVDPDGGGLAVGMHPSVQHFTGSSPEAAVTAWNARVRS